MATTPEERARKVQQDWQASGCCNDLPCRTMNNLIAAAIRNAVEAEREACANFLTDLAADHEKGDDSRYYLLGLAYLIRTRDKKEGA